MSVWLPLSTWLTRPGLGHAASSCSSARTAWSAISSANEAAFTPLRGMGGRYCELRRRAHACCPTRGKDAMSRSRTPSIVFASTRAPIPGPMRVPQLTPVHGAAVRKDDLAIDAQRRVTLDLGDAENKGQDVEICRNRPEDVEIRVRGQIGRGRSDAATSGCRRPRAPHRSVRPRREVRRSWIASPGPQRLRLHAARAETSVAGHRRAEGEGRRDACRRPAAAGHRPAPGPGPPPRRGVERSPAIPDPPRLPPAAGRPMTGNGPRPTPKRPAPHARDRAVSRDGSTSV